MHQHNDALFQVDKRDKFSNRTSRKKLDQRWYWKPGKKMEKLNTMAVADKFLAQKKNDMQYVCFREREVWLVVEGSILDSSSKHGPRRVCHSNSSIRKYFESNFQALKRKYDIVIVMKSFIIFILIQTILFGKMEKKKNFHVETALDILYSETINRERIYFQLSSFFALSLYFYPLPVILCSCCDRPFSFRRKYPDQEQKVNSTLKTPVYCNFIRMITSCRSRY